MKIFHKREMIGSQVVLSAQDFLQLIGIEYILGFKPRAFPSFEKRIRVDAAPSLEVRISDKGFNVSDGNATFVYRPFVYDPSLRSEGLYITEFPSRINSELRIYVKPSVHMETKYTPPSLAESQGNLSVIGVLLVRDDYDLANRFYYVGKVLSEFVQRAADKVLRELRIDEVHTKFLQELKNAITETSASRTLSMYLES